MSLGSFESLLLPKTLFILFSLDYYEQRPPRQTHKPIQKQRSAFSFVGSESSFTPAPDVELKLDAVTKLQAEFETGVEVHDTLNVLLPWLSCCILAASDPGPRTPHRRPQSVSSHCKPAPHDRNSLGHPPVSSSYNTSPQWNYQSQHASVFIIIIYLFIKRV